MANDDRRDRNRGMFGYEGEGYLRGGGRDIGRGFRPDDYGDFNRGDYARDGYGQASARDIDDDRRGYGIWAGAAGPREERTSFRGRGPKNYQRSDSRIFEDVCERLEADREIDASDIEVSVDAAVVTLSGKVRDRFQKRWAEDVADSVPGVNDVQNNIRLTRED